MRSFRESVWENLARMCVLTRRADVAKICLGKMGLFRGARALRAVDQDNPDTKIAILAIHLNMKVIFIKLDSLNFHYYHFFQRKKQKRFYCNPNSTIYSINCINRPMNGKKPLMLPRVMIASIYEIHIIIMLNLWKKPIK